MAWPLSKVENKEEKNEENKTPVDDKNKNEKPVAELIADAIKPFSERFEKLDQRFQEMDSKFVSKPAKPAEGENKENKRVSVFDDEDLGIAQRIAPVAAEVLGTKAEMLYDRAARAAAEEVGADAWAQIEPDVRKILDETTNLMLKSNPIYIANTIDMVVGKKLRSGVRFDSTGKRFFLEDASHSADAKSAAAAEEGLSRNPKIRERQLKVMKQAGMTLDQYKKAMGDLEVMSDNV